MMNTTPRSILYLIGYLLGLMLLFYLFVQRADAYYKSRDDDFGTNGTQLLTAPFHHVVVKASVDGDPHLSISYNEELNELESYYSDNNWHQHILSDTLYILGNANNYSQVNLRISQKIASITLENVSVQMEGEVFDPLSQAIIQGQCRSGEKRHINLDLLRTGCHQMKIELANYGLYFQSLAIPIDLKSIDITGQNASIDIPTTYENINQKWILHLDDSCHLSAPFRMWKQLD
jgi:hypothetical protein